jgi:hypothetical protein
MRLQALIATSELVFGLTMFVGPGPVLGQAAEPRLRNDLLINVALGGLTGAIGHGVNPRRILRGFLIGSIGGATTFVGKCITAQRHPITSWLGRGTAAVGSSIVRNATLGKGALEQIVVPVGPINFYRDNKAGRQWLRIDVGTSLAIGYVATRRHRTFNASETLRNGVVVFSDAAASDDLEVEGIMVLSPHPDEFAIPHELTHVAQDASISIAWEEPLEGWIAKHIHGAESIHARFDLGVLEPIWQFANTQLRPWNRPWETEAHTFAIGCP